MKKEILTQINTSIVHLLPWPRRSRRNCSFEEHVFSYFWRLFHQSKTSNSLFSLWTGPQVMFIVVFGSWLCFLRSATSFERLVLLLFLLFLPTENKHDDEKDTSKRVTGDVMLKLNQYFSGKGIRLCPAVKELRERGTTKEQDTEEFSKREERASQWDFSSSKSCSLYVTRNRERERVTTQISTFFLLPYFTLNYRGLILILKYLLYGWRLNSKREWVSEWVRRRGRKKRIKQWLMMSRGILRRRKTFFPSKTLLHDSHSGSLQGLKFKHWVLRGRRKRKTWQVIIHHHVCLQDWRSEILRSEN